MKIVHSILGSSLLALIVSPATAPAQNVGIGLSNPASKLTVNGNLAVGADYNTPAPTNGALIEGTVGIGTTIPNSASQLHIFNPNTAYAILESGGGTSTTFAWLRLVSDSATNHHVVLELSNSARSAGFQWVLDPNSTNKNSFSLYDLAANTNRIFVDPTGNVGIGTITPLAPLHVGTQSTIVNSSTQSYFSFNNTSTLSNQSVTNQTNNASAIFLSNVWTSGNFVSYNGTLTASDARLKNVIGRSDSAKDLETLAKIEVTDYTMKDVVKFGNKPIKKVIAQQVEKVYPTAVTSTGIKGFTFTPDVYAVSDSIKIEKPGVYVISLAKAHDLKDGDRVRLITSKNPEVTAVVHVLNDKAFSVETMEPLGDKVFVYGKECTDLKAVDYDAISILNLSATQELAKKVETLEQQNFELQGQTQRLASMEEQERALISKQGQQIAALDVENGNLKTEVAQLKTANQKVAAMAAEMEALKKVVTAMQQKEDPSVRTAALDQ